MAWLAALEARKAGSIRRCKYMAGKSSTLVHQSKIVINELLTGTKDVFEGVLLAMLDLIAHAVPTRTVEIIPPGVTFSATRKHGHRGSRAVCVTARGNREGTAPKCGANPGQVVAEDVVSWGMTVCVSQRGNHRHCFPPAILRHRWATLLTALSRKTSDRQGCTGSCTIAGKRLGPSHWSTTEKEDWSGKNMTAVDTISRLEPVSQITLPT